MRHSALRLVLGLVFLVSAALAGAVGVANDGAYRVRTNEREPAEPGENIRIVPPPTGGVLKVEVRTDKARYHVYDPMQVFFSVNKDAYVYIFDTDAAGVTHQIFPNYYDTNSFIRAGKTYYIPDRGYDLEVMGPQGRATLTIVATLNEFPFLNEYRNYTKQDPYPASREGATALVRQIEQFRGEPSALGVHPLRPAPKENLWASESTTYYVMGNEVVQPPVYKTPRFGRLDVDSYPSNARIYIDADYYGRTSQVIDRLEIGYHHIRLEKEGYIPYDCNIYIKGNETKHMDIFLQQTPVMPSQEAHDGQMRGGSTFGFFNESGEGAGAGAGTACPPGTAPVAPAAAPPSPPRRSAAEDQETREK
jgi:hypothetical protein